MKNTSSTRQHNRNLWYCMSLNTGVEGPASFIDLALFHNHINGNMNGLTLLKTTENSFMLFRIKYINRLAGVVHVNLVIDSNQILCCLPFLIFMSHATVTHARTCHQHTTSSPSSTCLPYLSSTYLTYILCIFLHSQLMLSFLRSLYWLWPFLQWNRILPISISLMH